MVWYPSLIENCNSKYQYDQKYYLILTLYHFNSANLLITYYIFVFELPIFYRTVFISK